MRRSILLAAFLVSACQSTPPPAPSAPQYEPIAGEALDALIVGKVARFADNSATATYFADGRYEYFGDDQQGAGTYTVEGDKVCVKFAAGQNRCGEFAMIGTDYWIIATDDGTRQKLLSITAPGEPGPKQS